MHVVAAKDGAAFDDLPVKTTDPDRPRRHSESGVYSKGFLYPGFL